MKLKKIWVIFSVLPFIFLTGCWSSHEINNLAITVCMGIDKTENGYLLTEQIVNPKVIASKKATNEAPVVLYSDTGKDLLEIERKLETKCSRRIYNSHLRMVILGEAVAREGIQGIVDFFQRGHEYRTDFYFVVAKGTTANKVLSTLTPLESIPGIEMYDSLEISEKFWAPTKSIRIIELMNDMISDGKNPVLTGIEITQGEINSNSTDALKKSDEIKKLKYSFLGVFKKDKLVGWLKEDESKGYNYIIGNVESTAGYVNYGDKVKISNAVIKAKSVMKASLINDKPVINVEINLEQNIGSVEGEFDVSKEENIKIVNELGEKKIKQICENAVDTAQSEFKTDIFGFGEVIHRKYPKLWGRMKDDWNNEFADLKVNITVEVKTNQLGQITK